MIVAVDFDGVLHDPSNRLPGYRMGQPIAGAVEAVGQLFREGHVIVVHTVRDDSDRHVTKWLAYFKVPHNGVTNRKPNADVFIDDKAIRFTDWPSALAALAK